MILPALILGAVIVGTSLVAIFWNKVVETLQKVINKIKVAMNRTVLGCTIKLKRLGDRFQNRQSHFSKDEQGNWQEQIVTYEQNAEEIPDKYKEGNYATMDDEFDISDDLELQLKH
ncbi:MAG: hypothetical protein J6K17_09295 [Oscillospiraceae bacterium]|nr:hypothetical protein [Oscillospiraceae bacterium]